MEAVLFPIFALIFFLFFTETVTFNIIFENELIIDIDLLILGIRLYPQRSVRKSRIKKRKSKHRQSTLIYDIIKSVSLTLPSTEINLNYLYLNLGNKDYANSFLIKGISISLIKIILDLAESKAKKINTETIIIDTSDNNNNKFILDARISIPFFIFIYRLFGFIVDIKIKRKGKIKHVGR